MWFGFLLVACLFAFAAWWQWFSPDAEAKRAAHARMDAQLVCPHCQTKGLVRSTAVVRKKGISGGKATGAVMTGGVSMLATGLSRKEPARHLMCGNCGQEWDVA